MLSAGWRIATLPWGRYDLTRMKREISCSRVIVTRRSSGIGRALVVELCRGGAKVVAVARRAERLAELAAATCASRAA